MSYSYEKDLFEHLQFCLSRSAWITFFFAQDLLSLKFISTDSIVGGPYGVDYFCEITELGIFFLSEFHGQQKFIFPTV